MAPARPAPSLRGWPRLLAACVAGLIECTAAWAQSAERGANLYMRLPNGSRSCLSCHGAEPAANPNNLLRAADNPQTLTRVLNTVSAMGFLNSQLDDTDRADIAAFLGSVAGTSADALPLAIGPATLESGTVQTGGATGAPQRVRIANRGSQPVPLGAIAAAGAGFSVAHDCPPTLAAGASCEVATRLQPGAPGWRTAALRIESPALPRPFLAGASVQGSTEPASALVLADGAASATWTSSDGATVRRALRLANPGPMPAQVDAVLLLGRQAAQFRVESGCAAGTVLQAGTHCDIVAAWQPGQAARAEAQLRVRSNQGHPQSLWLQGERSAAPPTAVAPPPPATDSGGGCSTRPPGGRGADPTLLALVLAALAAAWARSKSKRPVAGVPLA